MYYNKAEALYIARAILEIFWVFFFYFSNVSTYLAFDAYHGIIHVFHSLQKKLHFVRSMILSYSSEKTDKCRPIKLIQVKMTNKDRLFQLDANALLRAGHCHDQSFWLLPQRSRNRGCQVRLLQTK